MEAMVDLLLSLLSIIPMGRAFVSITLGFLTASLVAGMIVIKQRNKPSNPPPVVPGLPLIGNLHQMKDKKPLEMFAKWAEIYGPFYSIRAGASSIVVLNSSEVAKEVLLTNLKFI